MRYRQAPGGLEAVRARLAVDCAPVVLSDRTIRSEIESGRIVVDPFDDSLIQPSSIDVPSRFFENFGDGD